MKKFLMVLFGMMFACNVYATTDIPSTATTGDCDETTLGTYSGSADLEIKWEPNTIPIRWYDNNTAIQNAQNTCNYDDVLTVPTPPSRNGYNFTGWKVRPMMDFSTLTSLETGSERWGKGYSLNSGADYCYYDVGTASYTVANCKTNSGFSTLNRQEWKVKFNSGNTKGILYGSAHCSAKNGDYHNWTWPAADYADWLTTYNQLENISGKKIYCWCQATGWQPENSDIIYTNSDSLSYGNTEFSSSSAWVFRYGYGSANYCTQICAEDCAHPALTNSAFRRALFVGTGN